MDLDGWWRNTVKRRQHNIQKTILFTRSCEDATHNAAETNEELEVGPMFLSDMDPDRREVVFHVNSWKPVAALGMTDRAVLE